jgi:hypothetical protein
LVCFKQFLLFSKVVAAYQPFILGVYVSQPHMLAVYADDISPLQYRSTEQFCQAMLDALSMKDCS